MVGDTIYNLMAMEKLETDKHDRPLNPPIILETKVVSNPFTDIFPRDLSVVRPDLYEAEQARKALEDKSTKARALKVSKKSNTPKVNLLSFGEEFEEDLAPKGKKKIICPQEIIKDDPSLAYEPAPSFPELAAREQELRARQALQMGHGGQDLAEGEEALGKRIRARAAEDIRQMQAGGTKGVRVAVDKRTGKKMVVVDKVEGEEKQSESETDGDSSSSSEIENAEHKEIREKQKDIYEKMRFDSLQFKADKTGSLNFEAKEAEKEEKALLSAVELKRYKYTKMSGGKHSQEEVLDKLAAFRNKLRSKEVKADPGSWMNSKLKFHIDSANAYSLQENKTKASDYGPADKNGASYKIPDTLSHL